MLRDLRYAVRGLRRAPGFTAAVTLSLGEAGRDGLWSFTTLGVDAAIGRTFGPADAEALERTPAVVLGHDLWMRRYAGDPAVVGQPLVIGGGRLAATVIGVLPPHFRDLEAAADRDLWLPPSTWALLNGQKEFEARDVRWFDIVARLRPGVTAAQASAETAAWAGALAETHAAANGGRGAARTREMGVRTAAGASRLRLFRQLMIENLLLGALGAAAGLLVAAWAIQLLPGNIGTPPGLRAFAVFALDAGVFAFTLVVTLLTTLAFGIASSWLASRPDVVPVLGGHAVLPAWDAGGRGLRGGLVAAQVAIAVVLLTAAGLFARSFESSRQSHPGFARKPIVAAWVLAEMPRAVAPSVAPRSQ